MEIHRTQILLLIVIATILYAGYETYLTGLIPNFFQQISISVISFIIGAKTQQSKNL